MKKTFIIGAVLLSITSVAYAAFAGPLPLVSDGTYQQWVAVNSGSGSHYETVDESLCNGVTDYVTTATTTSRDSYNVDISSVPNGTLIKSIHVRPCASKSVAAGASVMDVFAIFNTVQGPDKGAYNLAGTVPSALATTTFKNVNMVKTATSTLEIGAVYTSGTAGVRMSRIYTVLEY